MQAALPYIDLFAPAHNLEATAGELEFWEADGLFGALEYDDVNRLFGSLKRPLPLVNSALSAERPGMVTVLGDFSAFVEKAVSHLRQLGLRSLAVLVLEEGPQVREK